MVVTTDVTAVECRAKTSCEPRDEVALEIGFRSGVILRT